MAVLDFSELQTIASIMKNAPDVTIYRLRLSFRFDELVCIRDVAVNSKTTLDELHTIIQACGNWLNYHLYDFEFIHGGELTYAELPRDDGFGTFDSSKRPTVDSRTISIEDAIDEFPNMIYSYDYGDGWEIAITFLGFADPKSVKKVPYCLFGKGDWPPDDAGGEGGFIRLLEILKNPSDLEYNEYSEWADSQGFQKYSLASCNSRLANWQDYRAIEY